MKKPLIKPSPEIPDTLKRKTEQAIKLLQLHDKTNETGQPIELAYSGGKDSDVILHLAKTAGINFSPKYKNTTIDPPGTLKHVKDNNVNILQPKTSFLDSIDLHGLPFRTRRHCCKTLKEYYSAPISIIGVRKAESRNRNNRYQEPTACRIYNKTKNTKTLQILPIINFSDQDVLDYIYHNNIQLHPLYYNHFTDYPDINRRLGCIGCPIKSCNNRLQDFKTYPKLAKLIAKHSLIHEAVWLAKNIIFNDKISKDCAEKIAQKRLRRKDCADFYSPYQHTLFYIFADTTDKLLTLQNNFFNHSSKQIIQNAINYHLPDLPDYNDIIHDTQLTISLLPQKLSQHFNSKNIPPAHLLLDNPTT